MKEQIKWYFFSLFYNISTPIFFFIFFFININSGYIQMQSLSKNLNLAYSVFCLNGPFIHTFGVLIFIGYLAIALFTYPIESGISFFEFSLPYTKGKNFIAKFIAGILYASFILGSTIILSYFIKMNAVFGLTSIYLYLFILSMIFDLIYVFSFFVLFGLVFKRSVGVIIGILFFFILEEYVIYPLQLWISPIISSPLYSIYSLLYLYKYELPIGILLGAVAYLIYRRLEL